MTAMQTRTVPEVIAQTARTLPSSDAGWRYERFLDPGSAITESAGNEIGTATVVQRYGRIVRHDGIGIFHEDKTPDLAGTDLGTIVGRMIRFLKSDESGSVAIDTQTYTPFWWGVIQAEEDQPDGRNSQGGGVAVWQCADLRQLLQDVTIHRGWAVGAAGAGVVNPGRCPIFNRIPGGDRQSGTQTLNGQSVYIHSLAGGEKWTARQIVEHLLILHTDPWLPPGFDTVSTLSWQLGGQTTCLDYIPDEFDAEGLTVFEAVNSLINDRRGCTYDLSVSGDTVTINVRSTTAAAITVGGFTLPASTNSSALDYTADSFLRDLRIIRNEANTFDAIYVKGARPRNVVTLEATASSSNFLSDFTGSTATSSNWDVWTQETPDESTSIQNRYLKINADFDGETWNNPGNGLRNYLEWTTTFDTEHGLGGYTGNRFHLNTPASATITAAQSLELDRTLPIPETSDVSSLPTSMEDAQEHAPIFVVQWSDGTYEDFTERLGVEVMQVPASIMLGDGPRDAYNELSALADGLASRWLLTLSFREPAPLQVSWIRDRSEWPRDTPRVQTIELPDVHEWIVTEGAVLGTTALGALETAAQDHRTRDDRSTLDEVLALARAYYSEPKWNVSYMDFGQIDTSSATKPGALITTVTAAGKTETVNAVRVKRTWQRTQDTWNTVHTARPLVPDIGGLAQR